MINEVHMDKIFSTRLDEDLIQQIDRFVKSRFITKKSLVENALRTYINGLKENLEQDMISESFGAWQREETAEETWALGKKTFRRAFQRHKQKKG